MKIDAIAKIRQKARSNLKTIVLPEYNDKRVVEAVKIIEKEGLAKPILLSPDKVDPKQKERYIEEFSKMHEKNGWSINEIRKLFEDTLYYGAMMTREGKADGFVAGASHTTADMARAAIHCLEIDTHLTLVCGCFIMIVPDCSYGERGTFIFADCGIIPEPNSRQLAYIALASAELIQKVVGIPARVAFLSYSTKGSAKCKSADKEIEALEILKEVSPSLIADGELQVDAAIVPEVAIIKYPDSPVAGKANVLIFPDLDAGNISYKLIERLAKARALGPLMLGLTKPCSDLSRGCSIEDIVDCTAVTAIRAQ